MHHLMRRPPGFLQGAAYKVVSMTFDVYPVHVFEETQGHLSFTVLNKFLPCQA